MTKNIEKTLDFKVEIYYNSSMGCFAPINIEIKEGKIMVKNKIYKILISIIILIMMFTIIGKTITLAEVKTEDIDLALSGVRVIKNGTSYDSSSTRAYALNTGSNHQIYQIVSLKKK